MARRNIYMQMKDSAQIYYLACWDWAKVRDQSGQGVIPANTAMK